MLSANTVGVSVKETHDTYAHTDSVTSSKYEYLLFFLLLCQY